MQKYHRSIDEDCTQKKLGTSKCWPKSWSKRWTASKILQKMVCEGEKWRFTNPTNPVQLIGGLQSMDWNSQSRNSGLLDRFHWIAQIPILGLGFRNLEKRGSWIDFQGLCNPNPRIIQSLQSNPCNPIHGLQKMPSTNEISIDLLMIYNSAG